MRKNTFHPMLLVLAALLFLNFGLFAKDCVGKIPDVEWCVEGIKLESFSFPAREFKIGLNLNSHPFPLNGKTNFSALVNWWNVEIKVDKKLSEEEMSATVAGYFSKPDYENPGVAIIFVKTKNKKKLIESEIKAAQERFSRNCFGCEQLGIKDPGLGSSKKRK